MLTVSNSVLAATAKCDTEAYLKFHKGLAAKEQVAQLHAGTAIHEALAGHFRGLSKIHCLAEFAAAYQGTEAYEDTPYAFGSVMRILDKWLSENPLASLPFEVVTVEERVKVPFAPGVEFSVKLDALVKSKIDGGLYVVDHKTTAHLTDYWLAKYELDSQMTGYLWAVNELYREKGLVVQGAVINAIEIKHIPNSNRKCRDHGVEYFECGLHHLKTRFFGPILRSPEQIENWKRNAEELTDSYTQLTGYSNLSGVRQQGMFSNSCSFCDFKPFCLAGRPEEQILEYCRPSSYEL